MNGKRKTFAYRGGILILGLIAVVALNWGPGRDVLAPHSTPGTRLKETARITAPSLPLATRLSPTRAGLAPAGPPAAPPVLETYARMPLRFESWPQGGRRDNDGEGRGQFLARGSGYSVLLAPTEAVLAVHASAGSTPVAPGFSPAQRLGTRANAAEGTAGLKAGATQASLVCMQLAGANAAAPMRGEGMLPGRVNYYLGNDPKKWRTNVRTYAKVRDEAVYPGIDLVYYGNQGQLEYDFVVAPGADPGAIRLRFEGAEKLEVDAQGDLALRTPAGPIHLRKPVVYQAQSVVSGQRSLATDYGRGTTDNPQSKIQNRKYLDSRYVLTAQNEIRFEVGPYDPTGQLIIDPVLTYSTYLGGSNFDSAHRIAVDAEGNMYIVGSVTTSIDFPTENAFQPEHHGGPFFYDTFVTKFDPSGQTLVYSTYLGGRGDDVGFGIAVDAEGNAYVAGATESPDFPTVNAFQPALRGSADGFVTKIDATGSVVYSTYLGGSSTDAVAAIAVDAKGNAYVAGNTASTDFPTMEPFQPNLRGQANAFVTKLDPTGSTLVYSTYLGGDSRDAALAIAVDGDRNVYVTGQTQSLNFPIANAFQPAYGGGSEDAFVTKFDPTGQTLIYSTYLGGSAYDVGVGIAVDTQGGVYVSGSTSSRDFPTANPIQPDFAGGPTDAFVTKFDASGSVVYSTYLGGNDFDAGETIAVDAEGNAYVTGETISPDFPTKNPLQPALTGFINVFVAEFDASGTTLLFSTYLGGSVADRGPGIAVDASGNVYVTGETVSPDFPLQDPFQKTLHGSYDVFVSRISPDPDSRLRKSQCCLPFLLRLMPLLQFTQ